MLATLLTPTGRGAIAVIHICGEGARGLVGRFFARPFENQPVPGRLTVDGEVLDEVMVRTATGFTGEETVEITCHGGSEPVERILEAMAAAGARRVDAAGLLERGVETGHLDRIQAEAWTLLPHARTELAAQMLLDQAGGALSGAVKEMKTAEDGRRLLVSVV